MSDTPKEFYLDKSDPAAWAAFGALSKQAGESARAAGLDDQLIELVCLRIQQVTQAHARCEPASPGFWDKSHERTSL